MQDLEELIVLRILLYSKEKRNARLACRKWKQILDYVLTGHPLLNHVSPSYVTPSFSLKSPKDPLTSEGCLSWCRRNANLLTRVDVTIANTWWLLPFAPVGQLVNVRDLDINGSSDLEASNELQLGPLLSPLISLQHLSLYYLPITSLDPLSSLTALKHLNLEECTSISDTAALQQLTSLSHLGVLGCDQSIPLYLDELAALTGLQTLTAELPDVDGISNLSALTALTWRHIPGPVDEEQFLELKHLPNLSRLNLEIWHLYHPEFLQSSSLTSLRLWDFPETGSVKDKLRGLPRLRQLSFVNCPVTDLSDLTALEKLEILDVREENLELNANTLRGLTQLKQLYINSYNYDVPKVDLSPLNDAGVELKVDAYLPYPTY
jgi:hypothetical protein